MIIDFTDLLKKANEVNKAKEQQDLDNENSKKNKYFNQNLQRAKNVIKTLPDKLKIASESGKFYVTLYKAPNCSGPGSHEFSGMFEYQSLYVKLIAHLLIGQGLNPFWLQLQNCFHHCELVLPLDQETFYSTMPNCSGKSMLRGGNYIKTAYSKEYESFLTKYKEQLNEIQNS